MRTFLLFVASVYAFTGEEIQSKFAAWKKEHGKTYETMEALNSAMEAFASNDKIIQEHNAKELSWTLGHNEFSDMTWEQFKSTVMSEIFTNRAPANMDRVHLTDVGMPLPDAVDWVEKGAVTPVKNQKRCGSCWVSCMPPVL